MILIDIRQRLLHSSRSGERCVNLPNACKLYSQTMSDRDDVALVDIYDYLLKVTLFATVLADFGVAEY